MTSGQGFRTSDIRRKMDVYTLDGVHLGTVTRVFPGDISAPVAGSGLAGTAGAREFDGEAIGPAPTRSVGNPGPGTQSPENAYGTRAHSGDGLGNGEIEIATIAGLFGRRRLPLSEVQTVALERVVLRQPASAYEDIG